MRRTSKLILITVGLACAATPTGSSAQLPLLPVLQNGFISSGTTVGINVGSATNHTAYAVAASWAPRAERFAVTGGVGFFDATTGDRWSAYGARLVIPVISLREGSIGFAAFGGIGGGRHDTTSVVRVPAGLAVGYRHAIGDSRGISVYATPFFVWARESVGGRRGDSGNGARASLGLDIALARTFGLTLGYEFGSAVGLGPISTGNGVFGAGVAYAFR
jgi:hypothetical protein